MFYEWSVFALAFLTPFVDIIHVAACKWMAVIVVPSRVKAVMGELSLTGRFPYA